MFMKQEAQCDHDWDWANTKPNLSQISGHTVGDKCGQHPGDWLVTCKECGLECRDDQLPLPRHYRSSDYLSTAFLTAIGATIVAFLIAGVCFAAWVVLW